MQIKKIILGGIQASGKGTQAKKLSEKLNIEHINTGQILRDYITAGSELVDGYSQEDIDSGKMAPTEVIDRVMRDKLKSSDSFILDGFPRNNAQLDILNEVAPDVDLVIILDVDEATAIERMLKRGRSDDTIAGIKTRLATFNDETYPIIKNNLSKFNNFYTVDSTRTESEVFDDITTLVSMLG